MKIKTKIIKWINNHKKQLIAAGVCVSSIIALVYAARNMDAIVALWKKLKALLFRAQSAVTPEEIKTTNTKLFENASELVSRTDIVNRTVKRASEPFIVNMHIRNLNASGREASEMKKATAAAMGIVLGPGQT